LSEIKKYYWLFWVIYGVQLGIIVPFISAGLIVIDAIIGKLVNRDINKITQIYLILINIKIKKKI